MSFNYTGPNEKIILGRDFNFFAKVTSTVPSTASPFAAQCDLIITFPTAHVTFILESGTNIQYSFNGNTVHGDMTSSTSSASLSFPNRAVSKIWFKGTGVVRVEAYGTR